MLFSSTVFLYLFLPSVLLIYFVILRKKRGLQNGFLVFASLFFYAWGEPVFVLVMILTVLLTWAFGMGIERQKDDPKLKKFFLIFSVVCLLSVLFICKYLGFACSLLKKIIPSLSVPGIPLPIGISFFTFQAISYIIDVYRGKAQAQKNLLYVGLYISFFPQLIAGPIVRYQTVAEEIKNRKENMDDFSDGFARFVIGLSKKVLLSNKLALIADQAFAMLQNGDELSVTFSWLGGIAFTMQIFFDFSGYSDMAIGLGRMFGFHFGENFNYPYIAGSVSDFWRRWHISLGQFFRDYVYFPLGGSRGGTLKTIMNLFIVWFLTGLWHGANLTFIMWGLMYFVLITAEKLSGIEKKKSVIIKIAGHIYTVLFAVFGMVLFNSDTIQNAVKYWGMMTGAFGNSFTDGMFSGYFTQNLLWLAVSAVLCTPVFRYIGKKTEKSEIAGWIRVAGMMALFVLCAANIVSDSYNPFIYFNF